MPATTAESIFERHHLAVYRYFSRLTGRQDQAEDLTQEVFLRVVRSLSSYQALGHDGRWVFTIAKNVLVDHQRSTHAAPRTVRSLETICAPDTQLLAFSMREALEMLPALDRHAFVLHEVVGLSYAEIADACETTTEAVRSRLYPARLDLRRSLGNRSEHPPDEGTGTE